VNQPYGRDRQPPDKATYCPDGFHLRDRPRVVPDGVREQELGVPSGGDLHHPAAQVVPHQDGVLEPDLLELGSEVVRLLPNRDVATSPLGNRLPVTHHLPCQRAGTSEARHHPSPQLRRGGDAVHENYRLAVTVLEPAHPDAPDQGRFLVEAGGEFLRWKRTCYPL
jgi:hypothetical protein